MYAIARRLTFTGVRHAAIAFERELERRLPSQVTTNWWEEERGERIFIDYNQKERARSYDRLGLRAVRLA
jgi:DNA primase